MVLQNICGSLYVLGLTNLTQFDIFMKFFEGEIEFRFRDIEEGIFEAELKAHTEFTELVRAVLVL